MLVTRLLTTYESSTYVKVPADELYERYEEFCKSNKIRIKAPTVFGKGLKEVSGLITGANPND